MFMFEYMLRTMLKRNTRNLVLLAGLLALSSGLSTYVSASQNARVSAGAAIDQHWRGAYDLLVRPSGAVQKTEREYGLVESNYLSVGESGISVEQWKQIQAMPDIEIAAPVAAIGYLRNIAGNIGITIPAESESQLLRVGVEISSTNGYKANTLVSQNEYYQMNPGGWAKADADPKTVMPLTTAPGFTQAEAPGSVAATVHTPPVMWTLVASVDPMSERRLVGLDQAIVQGQYLSDNDGLATEKVPERGSPQDIAQGKSGMHRETAMNRLANPDGPNLPIIFATSSYISLTTSIKVDRLQMLDSKSLEAAQQARNQGYGPEKSTDELSGGLRRFFDALNQPVTQKIADFHFDYGQIIKPLSFHALNLDIISPKPSIQVVQGLSPIGANNAFPIAYDQGFDKTYRPGAISYSTHNSPFNTNGLLSLTALAKPDAQTIISLTGEVAFRSLPIASPAMAPARKEEYKGRVWSPFSFNEVGSYDLSKLPAAIREPDPLSYVPLGIYQPPVVKLVRDAEGNLLAGGPVDLHPTLNPASFIPGPPLALTNIAAARFFRGDNCIDAIRIRVAGIDRYTPENVKKVEDVAARIINATGLHVDIVAGSSPQKVLVYIPGSPDGKIAPLGYVEEQWTTLGAAAAISSGIDQTSFLMLGATGFAGLLYLVSQSLLGTLARRRELALVQALGWRRRHIGALIVGESAILGLFAGLCAVVLSILFAKGLGLVAPPEQAAVIGLVTMMLYIVAGIGPALWVVRQPVAELLQRGEVALPSVRVGKKRAQAEVAAQATSGTMSLKGKSWSGVWGLSLFAWRTLYSRRARSLLAAGSLAVATLLLMLIMVALASLGGTLRVTLLGQFVGLQVQSYHLIMVASAVIMSVLAVADHLAMGVLERRHELALLQAIGWRRGAVRLSILFEGIWLGLAGGVAGGIVATAILLASNASLLVNGWWVLLACMAAMLVLCGLSALYAISLTARQPLVRAMQQQ